MSMLLTFRFSRSTSIAENDTEYESAKFQFYAHFLPFPYYTSSDCLGKFGYFSGYKHRQIKVRGRREVGKYRLAYEMQWSNLFNFARENIIEVVNCEADGRLSIRCK